MKTPRYIIRRYKTKENAKWWEKLLGMDGEWVEEGYIKLEPIKKAKAKK